jgi:hypothetical protein
MKAMALTEVGRPLQRIERDDPVPGGRSRTCEAVASRARRCWFPEAAPLPSAGLLTDDALG